MGWPDFYSQVGNAREYFVCFRTCSTIAVVMPTTAMMTDPLTAVLVPDIRTSTLILKEIKKKEVRILLVYE